MPFDNFSTPHHDIVAVSHVKRRLSENMKCRQITGQRIALICYLMRKWLTEFRRGHVEIYPGRKQMVKVSTLDVRNVTATLRWLEGLGILIPVGFQAGGRGHATEFRFSISALIAWMRTLPKSPTKLLFERLEMINFDHILPPIKGDVTSPRLIDNYCTSTTLTNVVPRSGASASNIQPDRFSSTVALCLEDPAAPCDDPRYLQSQQEAAQWVPCHVNLSDDPITYSVDERLGHGADAGT